jgi:PQQ-dependent catabolism-associated CXXCW motif protein
MFPRVIAAALGMHAALALAQGYADEARDWGVAPQSALRNAPYTAPTPAEIRGARVVGTGEMQRLLSGNARPALIDVASGEGHITLAGALWWPGMGRGSNFVDAIQGEFAQRLGEVTGGNRASPMAFFCVNAQCWLSYNASLRAVALGYTQVLWYRGGVEAWREAGLALGRVREPWGRAGPVEPAADALKPR